MALLAVARRAGEALRRGSLGELRPFSALRPSRASSASDEVTERRVCISPFRGLPLRRDRR
jgi:hypothetical protein